MQGLRLADPVFGRWAKEIRADPSVLGETRRWAEDAARSAGLSEPECYQVKLAMSEAVTNAIRHGSRHVTDSIWLSIFEDQGALVFEVRDTGQFVPRASDDDEEGGRGLGLLALMMDEVEIAPREGGSLMRFAKRLP